MKKLFSLLAILITINITIFAQLPDNSVAPDWTLRDLNGNTHHLYDYLDNGYTVFIDVSAAWCGPCWSYHNTHALRDIYEQHGPTGYPSVVAGTTNNAMVFFIEGESRNTTAQLYGTAGTAAGQTTQGNWVTGTTYPIIDTPAVNTLINAPYKIGYFPTIYKICPNRIISEIGAVDATTLYAGVGTCSPVAHDLNDPMLLRYTGDELSLCNTLNIKATMFNYGTSPLTAATVKVYQGTTEIGSYNWTGSINTYTETVVNVGTVTVTSTGGPVTVKITSTNDDVTNDQVGVTYSVIGTTTSPYTQDNESAANINTPPADCYLYDKTADVLFIQASDYTTPPADPVGGYGLSAKSMAFDFYNSGPGTIGSVVYDKITVPTLTAGQTAFIKFDHSYAPYTGTPADALAVDYSTNCGTTWTSVFNKSGAALGTVPTTGSFHVPTPSSWTSDSGDVTANVSNKDVIIRVKGTSAYGNVCYVDNVKLYLKTAVGIEELTNSLGVNVYPNPTTDKINVSFNLDNSSEVSVKLYNNAGGLVQSTTDKYSNGANQVSFNATGLAAGVYNVVLSNESTTIKRSVVVK